jgi:hypothetical protein
MAYKEACDDRTRSHNEQYTTSYASIPFWAISHFIFVKVVSKPDSDNYYKESRYYNRGGRVFCGFHGALVVGF